MAFSSEARARAATQLEGWTLRLADSAEDPRMLAVVSCPSGGMGEEALPPTLEGEGPEDWGPA